MTARYAERAEFPTLQRDDDDVNGAGKAAFRRTTDRGPIAHEARISSDQTLMSSRLEEHAQPRADEG